MVDTTFKMEYISVRSSKDPLLVSFNDIYKDSFTNMMKDFTDLLDTKQFSLSWRDPDLLGGIIRYSSLFFFKDKKHILTVNLPNQLPTFKDVNIDQKKVYECILKHTDILKNLHSFVSNIGIEYSKLRKITDHPIEREI